MEAYYKTSSIGFLTYSSFMNVFNSAKKKHEDKMLSCVRNKEEVYHLLEIRSVIAHGLGFIYIDL